MLRFLVTVSVIGFLPLAVSSADVPPRLSVLFLGDKGHHVPVDRFEQIGPVLASRGIDATYTENLGDLNSQTLAKYNGLVIYANIDVITREAESALMAYIEHGGGLVALHCASYCFRNSKAYIELVGAQFKHHGLAQFETKVADDKHPIMSGLEPFLTWDETYVHTLHNDKNRRVLQTRAEGLDDEPWTWVRTHGKGRVFYTAYGHDARTWGHPGFHDLVERGIRWAAGQGPVVDSRPRVAANLKPFEYETSADRIPKYVPSTKWGVQGDPINQMQKPLDPAESMTHLALNRGFEVKLFASEPQIHKPVTMAWDHKGRLWIAETLDYPNDLQPPGKGNDRISICEDTDGDGGADKFTVFADKLSIPTSLAFANGGVIVHQAPDTLFLKDTDGDDKADVREVLFSGWNTKDTHAGPSNLHWGFDNWLWGIVGYSGFKGTVGGESQEFRTGFYRFKPDGSKMEFLRNMNNNSWGFGLSEEGLIFGSTANGCPSVYLPIANRYYESVRGWSSTVLQNIADSNRFFPVTEKVRQVDWHGGFTAAAGHALYTARTYPEYYWNQVAFVADPTGHLVATFALVCNGSEFRSHNSWNLVASDDEWCAPIMAEVGPDGNVWIIDWYNYIVQHNPTPRGFQNGKGNAYETPLRDKTRGRIYRVVLEGFQPSTPIELDPDNGPKLVAALNNENLFWRLHAQRLLIERGKADVVGALVKLVDDPSVDAIGLNPGAIHALWTLHGLDALKGDALDAVFDALDHPSAGVRRNAVEVLPRSSRVAERKLVAVLRKEFDPHVRLAALLALAEVPKSDAVAKVITETLVHRGIGSDRGLADAATSAAAAHDVPFLKAVADTKLSGDLQANVLTVIRRVAEHTARGEPTSDEISSLIVSLGKAEPSVADEVVLGLSAGWPKDRPLALSEKAEEALAALLTNLSAEAKGPLVSLAGRWQVRALDKYAADIADALLASVREESRSDEQRLASARQLIAFRPTDTDFARRLLELVTAQISPELAIGLVDAIGKSESAEIGAALASRLSVMTPAVRKQAIRSLLGRADWASLLLKSIEDGDADISQLSLDQRQALVLHPNKALASRAEALLKKGGGLPDPDRQKVIDSLGPHVLHPANSAKGKEVYKSHCAKCHPHSGEGGKVGPDLSGVAVHPKHELLIQILDPSRNVEGNYLQYTLATKDGRVLNGLLASESRTAVELLDPEGKTKVVLRSDIEEIVATKKSLMPDGFEKLVSTEALADLLEFLTHRGKYLPLDLRKVATVVSTQGMFYDKNSPVERMIFSDWSPKMFAGVPFLLVDPKGDRIPNAILLFGPQGTIPPSMPKSVTLPCRAPAKAIHLLSGVSGWGATSDHVRPTVSLIVRVHYSDGQIEDHSLQNGIHFADYIRRIDVPGSTFAFALREQQIRYLIVKPFRSDEIGHIELIKGPDDTAPIVMAVTLEAG